MVLPQFKLGLAMPPEKKVGGLTRELGDAGFSDVRGRRRRSQPQPGGRQEGAAQPGGRSQKRRARREAALDSVERAGELAEPSSRAGRWRLQQREQVE